MIDRFVIYDEGHPFGAFESEVHIKDNVNADNLIIIKSGYSDMEPTKLFADEILKLLNHAK